MNLPDIELVAAAVHEAWIAQKRAKGIASAPSQTTGEEQMRPYAELSHEVQEYDRATVRAVYAAIAEAGATTGAETQAICDYKHGGTPCADHFCHVRYIDTEEGPFDTRDEAVATSRPPRSEPPTEAASVDDALDIYVPGAWRCLKCGFALSKVSLFVQTGTVGNTRDEVMKLTGEVCPNDGEPMVRETWHERSEANYKWGVDLMEQIIALTKTDSLPAAIDAIKQQIKEKRRQKVNRQRGHAADLAFDPIRAAIDAGALALTTPPNDDWRRFCVNHEGYSGPTSGCPACQSKKQ